MNSFTPNPELRNFGYYGAQSKVIPSEFLLEHWRLSAPRSSTSPLPVYNLGVLETLPTELLLDILEMLPVVDLMKFQLLNRTAKDLADSIPKYRAVFQNAPDTIRGILASKPSIHITISSMYDKLVQRTCDWCGKLAQHIWLPTFSRTCVSVKCNRFSCPSCTDLDHYQWYRWMLNPSDVGEFYMMTPEDLQLIPTFRIPTTMATLTKLDVEVINRTTLKRRYDLQTASRICLDRHGVCSIGCKRKYKDPKFQQMEAEWRKTHFHTPFRPFGETLVISRLSTVAAPWLKRDDGEVSSEWGVLCIFCHPHWRGDDRACLEVRLTDNTRSPICRCKERISLERQN